MDEIVRHAVNEADRRIPVVDVQTMQARVNAAAVKQEAVGLGFATASLAALLIAAASALGLAR